MTQEALKLALEALITITDAIYVNSQQEADAVYKANDAITAIKEALAQTEQGPVAWQWLNTAHFRKKLPKDAGDGVWNPLYAAPQRTERPVDCERCNRLEEQAYDLVSKLRVANIKLSMQPQRTWVGLTISERDVCWRFSRTAEDAMEAVEAKLKEKNT